jgi:hypothetical protein
LVPETADAHGSVNIVELDKRQNQFEKLWDLERV